MSKISALIATMVLVALSIVSPVSAHVLKTDGTIGAILHIEPDDSPTAGQPTTYQLVFSDTSDTFRLVDCTCGVTIKQGTSIITTHPLTVSDTLESTDTDTFKMPAVYTLVINGKPKIGSSFQPFTLTYLIRVAANAQMNAQPFPSTLWFGFGMMVILLLLAAIKTDIK